MINEPQIIYPLFYKCYNKNEFENLLQQANIIIGFSNNMADTYCNPIIDKDGKYWFIVQPEVKEVVDLEKCVEYFEIKLPILELK